MIHSLFNELHEKLYDSKANMKSDWILVGPADSFRNSRTLQGNSKSIRMI